MNIEGLKLRIERARAEGEKLTFNRQLNGWEKSRVKSYNQALDHVLELIDGREPQDLLRRWS